MKGKADETGTTNERKSAPVFLRGIGGGMFAQEIVRNTGNPSGGLSGPTGRP